MLQKDGSVLFSKFYEGQKKHPVYGYGRLKNVEVFENRGIAKLKNRLKLRSTPTATQLPIAEVYDIYGNTYTLTGETGSGVCYKNGTALQSSLSNAWDLKIYKDYLVVSYASVLSFYGPLSSASAQWFGNLGTGFETVYRGGLLVGQDGYLYRGNGNYVARIEVTAAAPTVAPTVSVNATALNLPDGQYVSCLEEYNTKIAIGTHGGASYYARGSSSNARLYFWNRQLGTLGNPGLADLPIIFSENGVNAIRQHANKLYLSAGTQGNIYVTDSTNYAKLPTIPYTRSGIDADSTVYPNALTISAQGRLLVGLSGENSSISSMGVYEFDISDPNNPVTYRTTSSVASQNIKIGFVNAPSYRVLNVGWADGSTYGVDESDYVMYESYGGVIETELVKVGSYDDKATYEHIEWCLAEPLVSGQNIRISYRLNSKQDYTLINTWGYSSGTGVKVVGGVISFSDIAAIADAEYVQLKIELDQDDATLYGSNINLLSVRLW